MAARCDVASRAAFDHFIDIRSMSDREVAQRAREIGIDVLVDLTGFTAGSRLGVLAGGPRRCAGVLPGLPGQPRPSTNTCWPTRGDRSDDDARSFYTEKIVRLPSYQANDTGEYRRPALHA